MPYHPDQEYVEYSEQDQEYGVSVSEAIYLIYDEEDENTYGYGICPELVFQETVAEKDLYDSMREEVYTGEELRG